MNERGRIDPEVSERIRRAVDPGQFLQQAKQGTYVCPWCGSGTGKNGTGMNYNTKDNRMHCWNCGKSYDVIDIYQKVHSVDFRTAVSELSHGDCFRQRECISPLPADPTPARDFTAYYDECRARLADRRAVEYLQGRGISLETAKAFDVGFDPAADTAESGHYAPRLIIPSGKWHYVGRRVDGVKEYAKLNPKNCRAGISHLKQLDKPGVVFVVEGAFSGMSIYEVGGGMPVVLNSADNAGRFVEHVKEHRPQALLLLALDDDSAGRKATKDIAEGLAAEKIPYRVVHGLADGNKDSNDLLQENRQKFERAVKMAMENKTSPFSGFLERIQSGQYKAVTTGIKELDSLMGGGFVPGRLTLIGAAPGKAKTALCQWIAETMATHNKNLRAVFLSMEMAGDDLLARSLSRVIYENGIGDLSPFDILNGKEMAKIQKGIDKYLSLTGGRVVYNPGVSGDLAHSRLLADIKNTINKQGTIDLLVVDYIQLIRDGDTQTEWDNIGKAMECLRGIAQQRNCIVIAVMATNRDTNRNNRETLFGGRGSSDLEYSADTVLMITDELTGDTPTGKDVLTAAKGRLLKKGGQRVFSFDGRHMMPCFDSDALPCEDVFAKLKPR